jgi:hypothetical protein
MHKETPCEIQKSKIEPLLPSIPRIKTEPDAKKHHQFNNKHRPPGADDDDHDDEEDESDRVPLETLEKLSSDADVQGSLRNPHLRLLLQEIDAADNPQQHLKLVMAFPIFTEFADACLRVCGLNTDVQNS